MSSWRLAVMTSGGDAPGMNACLRAVVRYGAHLGAEVWGIRRAYLGLLEEDFVPLGVRDVGGILQLGGTILQTARFAGFKQPEVQARAAEILQDQGITKLVVIGGDGSLAGGLALSRLGVGVAGVPGSIDNDVGGTFISIGVDSAVNTTLAAIDNLRDTASSHRRAFVVETMGRHSGYLALMAGMTGGAEVIHIPEAPMSLEEIGERVEGAFVRGKSHALVVVGEGASPKAQEIAPYLEGRQVGFEVRLTILGHVVRGGRPTYFDRLLATKMGVAAAQALAEGKSGVMTSWTANEVSLVPLEKAQEPSISRIADIETARVLAL